MEYYDPSRLFIKSLLQSLVPNLEEQSESELNKIHVILFTLNVKDKLWLDFVQSAIPGKL